MREKEILEQAIRQFNAITGAALEELPAKKLVNKADTVAELRFGKLKTQFWVEIKNEIREQNLHGILNQVKKNPAEWLLICQYIPKPIKEELKNRAINYLETAGNCFIRKDGLFFYINDKAVTKHRQPKEGRLWKQAGLKFLFGILIKPELLNTPFRAIAEITTVALGNIGPFIEELKEEGYVKDGVDNGKTFLLLENKEMLRNKWVELFNAVLKPKLKQGRFRFLNKNDLQNWQETTEAANGKFYWGGEPAAALLTGYLHPEFFTIYTKAPKTDIMKHLRLVPDKNGNVEIVDIFWNPIILDYLTKNKQTVPPLLAYAELITSLDSRNRETAERIKQKYLA
jgi:hypothetical protein